MEPDDAERIVYRLRVEAFLASREGTSLLTRDTLREGVTADALATTATEAARFADEALAIVEDEYRPAIACREGCSYCCRKPGVLVTIPELLRILNHLREAFDAGRTEAVRERAARYVALLQGRHFNDPIAESVPCPLLVDDRCSAYDVRPLVCRGFNSTSADACRNAHGSAERLIPMFAILKDVTDGATVGVAQQLQDAGIGDALVDLGTALHLALEHGGDIGDALVVGDRLLGPAEDSTWVTNLWSRLREVASEVGVQV
jgi:uncharacterized protein